MSQAEQGQGVAPSVETELGFDPQSKVDVKEIPDRKDPRFPDPKFWELTKPITYHARQQDFTAEPTLQTDYASVPRMFVWFLPRAVREHRGVVAISLLLDVWLTS